MGPGSLAHETSVWVLFVLDVITGGYSVQNQYLDDRGRSCSICTVHCPSQLAEDMKNESKQLLKKTDSDTTGD